MHLISISITVDSHREPEPYIPRMRSSEQVRGVLLEAKAQLSRQEAELRWR